MLYLFTENLTPRLKYVTEVIFGSVIPTEFQWINDEQLLQFSDFPVLNYSEKSIANTLKIQPHFLLFETDICKQDIEIQHYKNIPYFFSTLENADFPFDIFAATFYLVTRYEEYLPFQADPHNRFTAQQSLAFQNGFLQLPIVHIWCNLLKNKLLEKFPNLQFTTNTYHQINTFDIDVAYSYRGKPFFRQTAAALKDFKQFNFKALRNRFQYCISGNDPYDTYDYLLEKTKNTERIFFFQMGKYGKFDKNIPPNKHLKQLIQKLSKFGTIGIHPSYQSNENNRELTREITVLEQITQQKIIFSRQHYLKLTFPETYENLIANGISKDFTMGYADQIGFRAGIAVSYPFFNLKTNQIRPLEIVPFQVMDGTLNEYLHFSPDEAIAISQQIKKEVKAVGGTFVSIFHNSSLTENEHWKGWRKVFENILE